MGVPLVPPFWLFLMPRRMRRVRAKPVKRARRARRFYRRTGIRHQNLYHFARRVGRQQLVNSTATNGLLILRSQDRSLPIQTAPATAMSLSGFGAGWVDFMMLIPNQLSDVINYAEFTALFDAYRLKRVRLNLSYRSNSATTNGAGVMPSVYWHTDWNTAVVPTMLQLQEYGGCKNFKFGSLQRDTVTIEYTPRIIEQLDLSGNYLANTSSVRNSPWLSTQYGPNIPHYGLILGICDFECAAGSVQSILQFDWEYELELRTPK